jgi:hypothetical protein
MATLCRIIRPLVQCAGMLCTLLCDATRLLRRCLRSPGVAAAETLFLRPQLALSQERHINPHRATTATRFTLVWLSLLFDWTPRWLWYNQRHVRGGDASGFDCFGTGHRALDGPRSQSNGTRSSGRWRAIISHEASGVSPMTCGSNSACGSHRARSGGVDRPWRCHTPLITAPPRAAPVDTVVLRPAGAVLDGWHRTGPHSRGAQPLCRGGTRSAPWQRVA